MKRFAAILFGVLVLSSPVLAGTIDMKVDSAPNAADTLAFDAWKLTTYTNFLNGTLQNMANGAYPNSTNFAATDAIVDGTAGRQLVWGFFIGGESYASLVDDTTGETRFQVRSVFDWAGVPTDPYGWSAVEITDIDLDNDNSVDGVLGIFGDAFAPGGPYPTVADVANAMYTWQTYWTGEVRVRPSFTTSWEDQSVSTASLSVTLVPVPMAAPAGLALLAVVAGVRYMRRK